MVTQAPKLILSESAKVATKTTKITTILYHVNRPLLENGIFKWNNSAIT